MNTIHPIFRRTVASLLALSMLGQEVAIAAVSADEAAQLKTTLTPFGGEKAGNKDGSIPAWTGGLTQMPAGPKVGDVPVNLFGDKQIGRAHV